jgi:thiosulfate/3-mercaptopyruvate sulfurtransferase
MASTEVQVPSSSATPAAIEAATLKALIDGTDTGGGGGSHALRVVDLRWAPKATNLADKYREGHIPSAVFVDLDHDLSQPGGPGRHPLLPTERLAALLARLGVAANTYVVVYDDGPGSVAARLWFELRAVGHERVSVLSGGLAAWRAAGFPLRQGDETPTPVAPRPLQLRPGVMVDRAHVRRLLLQRGSGAPGGPLVLDARARARYRGDFEPLDARPGHIPGAVNAPFEENVLSAADPRLKSASDLRQTFHALGADTASEVVVSCGSGVTACHLALGMELAGLPLPKLYVGSFSEWAGIPEEPVATGSEPGKLEH